jgi:hypothetical protein
VLALIVALVGRLPGGCQKGDQFSRIGWPILCELTPVEVGPPEDWKVEYKSFQQSREGRPTVVVVVGEPDLSGYLIPLEGQEPALGASAIHWSDETKIARL